MVRAEDCVYMVLGWSPRVYGGDFAAGYRGIKRCWDRLRKRLIREWGPIRYVIVAEQHASGFPHVNVLLVNSDLAAACRGDGWRRVRAGWLRRAVRACGFGFRTWIEPVRSPEAISVYLSKLAGEIGKKSQVPLAAPPHFRRIRASRGMLPPRPQSSGRYTGRLVKQSAEDLAARHVSPLPAFVGRPEVRDLAEPFSADAWMEYCDIVEPEPGVRRVQRPHTREVLWVEYSFSGSERDCSDSRAGPPGPSAPDDEVSGGSGTAWDLSPDSAEDLRPSLLFDFD